MIYVFYGIYGIYGVYVVGVVFFIMFECPRLLIKSGATCRDSRYLITLVAGAGSITDLSAHSCLQVKALLHFLPVCSDILQICFIFEKNWIKNILKQV